MNVVSAYSAPAIAKPFELALFVATVLASFDNEMRPRPRSYGGTMRRRKTSA